MRKHWPVSIACEVLEVSASGYFNWRRQQSKRPTGGGRHSDEAVLAHMRAIHAEVRLTLPLKTVVLDIGSNTDKESRHGTEAGSSEVHG